MAQVDPAGRPRRSGVGLRSAAGWLIRGLFLLVIGLLLLYAVAAAISALGYVLYLATIATAFEGWGALNVVSALLSCTAVAGAAIALRRRRLPLALAFTLLALPTEFVIEASRCDVESVCRATGWAALPPAAFAWQVRIRPVIDPNEAQGIADGALEKAGSHDSAFRSKRFGDHWIVSSINDDGWPGAHAVWIDVRTAKTRLVPCPAGRIQCGMERPVASDGRRVFRNMDVGVAAIFPAGLMVCTARDQKDEPSGLFGQARSADNPCELGDDAPQMGVEIPRYTRVNGCSVAEARSLAWRPLSNGTAKLFAIPAPTLNGRPTTACELHESGQIQISFYTSAPSPSGRGPLRNTVYEAYIVTRPERLAEDVRAFEAFLKTVSIGRPL